MVLSELYEYINRSPVPSDAASARYTHEYLEACNQLFENGLLSHAKVCDIQGDVLVSVIFREMCWCPFGKVTNTLRSGMMTYMVCDSIIILSRVHYIPYYELLVLNSLLSADSLM